MSYKDSVRARLDTDFDRYPPLILFRQLHAIGIQLDAMEQFNPIAEEEIARCFAGIVRKLPDIYKFTEAEFKADARKWMADEDSYARQPSVPLHDLLPVAECILVIHAFFCEGPIRDAGLFAELRRQLFLNEASYHRVSLVDMQRGRAPPVTEVDEEPEVLIDTFLGGTPFWHLFHIQIPFTIPRKTFASHGIILGPPNHGKSQLLGSLVSSFLRDNDNPVGCFVLDPHGDLYSTLSTRVDPRRLVCLDPDTSPPPLNFLDFGTSTEAQTLQTFSYLMSSLSGGLSDKQGAIVPYLLKLLKRIPEASLETLRLLVDEKVKRPEQSQFASAIAMLGKVDQGFFHNQFYNSRMQETKDAIGWKLYAALSNETFREMFSAKHNSFDADLAMRERKVVLVKGSENTLGEAGAPIFLQFVVAQVMSAAFRRANIPKEERHLCVLIIDEAKHVFNDQTERILTECRKWNLGFLAASQLLSQIPDNVRSAIYGATAIKISGPVADSDAEQLRKEMYCSKEFIRSMKAKEASHADWAFYVTGMTNKAVRVRVPYGALENLSTQTRPNSGLAADIAQAIWDDPLAREYAEQLLAEGEAQTQRAAPTEEPPSRPAAEASEAAPKTLPRGHPQQQNELSLRDAELPLPSADDLSKPTPRHVDLPLPKPAGKEVGSDKPGQDAPVIAPGKDW